MATPTGAIAAAIDGGVGAGVVTAGLLITAVVADGTEAVLAAGSAARMWLVVAVPTLDVAAAGFEVTPGPVVFADVSACADAPPAGGLDVCLWVGCVFVVGPVEVVVPVSEPWGLWEVDVGVDVCVAGVDAEISAAAVESDSAPSADPEPDVFGDVGAAVAMPTPVATVTPSPRATARPANRAVCGPDDSAPMTNPIDRGATRDRWRAHGNQHSYWPTCAD